VEDRVEGTGQESRASPGGEFGEAKKRVAPPANLLAEQDDCEDIVVIAMLRTRLPSPGPG
jgi:hypothetical protein